MVSLVRTPSLRLGVPVAAALALSLAVAPPASAQRAAYSTAADLEPEGASHLLDVALLAHYAEVDDPMRAGGLDRSAAFAVHNRLFLGGRTGYCVGLDGEIGGGDTGLLAGLTAYATGISLRSGDGDVIALCGGAGLDGVAGSVPFAARFPVELSLGLGLGPVRIGPWLRADWIAGEPARQDGVDWLTPVDELSAGLLVRLGRQHRYWSPVSAGGGLAVGLVYREFMETRSFGVLFGLDLTGAR